MYSDLFISINNQAPPIEDTITEGNISIGPRGLEVDGIKTSVFSTMDEFEFSGVLLGQGISSVVKLMVHKQTGEKYALKEIRELPEGLFVKKNLVELKTLHNSSHPSIVSFYGAFYSEFCLQVILEYMDGGTIGSLIEKVGKIPENILSKISQKILRGLDYIHRELRIIHRDIKPQNILFNSQGDVKITDFGVSAEVSSSNDKAFTFVGTLKYMSPGRIQKGAYTWKSDIWSLGLVIFECATGCHPIVTNDHNAQPFVVLNTIVKSPSPKLPRNDFSSEFCDFIDLCLQKEEQNVPDCATLLEHAWIIKYQNDDTNLESWIKDQKDL